MKEQDIYFIQGNRLIAEFMGYYTESDDSHDISATYMCDDHLINISNKEDWETSEDDWASWLRVDEMRFHLSWDWLVPVIEEIHSLDCYLEDYSGEALLYTPILQAIALGGIGAAYAEVVEFIKWYNQNKY